MDSPLHSLLGSLVRPMLSASRLRLLAAAAPVLLGSGSALAAPPAKQPPTASAPAQQATVQLPGLASWSRMKWVSRGTRERMCDFAAYSAKAQDLPMAEDPLWRPPPPEVKAKLGEARKALMGQKTRGTAAEQALRALLQGPWVLTLGRMAVQDRDPLVATVTLEAMLPYAAKEPRLASLALGHVTAAEPERALAAVRLMGASHCDTALLFVLDALPNPNPRVGIAAVEAVLESARLQSDGGVLQRMLAWVHKREGASAVRVAAVRVIGEVGYLAAGNDLDALVYDPDPTVAGEALAALGRVAPLRAEPLLAPSLQASKPAVVRAGAIRAAARALGMQPAKAVQLLEPLLKDRTELKDPALPEAAPVTLGELARLALVQIRGS